MAENCQRIEKNDWIKFKSNQIKVYSETTIWCKLWNSATFGTNCDIFDRENDNGLR